MRKTMSRISVMLVDDHTVVREGIREMLKLETDLDIVGEARDGHEAVKMATELQPDVILMDIAMPRLNGLEAARQMVKVLPKLRIIILSAHCDDAYVKSAVDAGTSGFLLKHDSAHDICRAIREVSKGGIFFSPLIAKRFIRINPQSRGCSGKMERKAEALTSRQMEVLQLIAEGKTNKESAAILAISIKTVEKHRGQLMRKLDIHDTAGLTRHAIMTGIIECSVQVTIL
jgi:DNA-binding NarL/FixJ family response regulator